MRLLSGPNSAWVRRIVIAGIVGALLVAATVYVASNQLNGRTPGWARLDPTW